VDKVDQRIRFLDGLRAVSIGFVLLEHCTVSAHPGIATGFWKTFLTSGRFGVSIFFVISGYLITNILLRDIEKYGRVRFKEFFIRRAFRLYPVLYAFLAVVVSLNLFGRLQNNTLELAAAAAFLWNYAGLFAPASPDQWYLGHLWSLALEQQFYLIWPLALAWLGRRRAAIAAFVIALSMPALRVATYLWFPQQRGFTGMMFHTAADAVLAGCVVRLAQSFLVGRMFNRKIVVYSFFYAVIAVVFFLSPWLTNRFGGGYTLPFGITLEALIPAGVIIYCLANPDSPLVKVLNVSWLRHLGLISYSLYIWQQLFLGQSWFAQHFGVVVGLGLALCVAEVSYRWFETPVREWGRKLLAEPVRAAAIPQSALTPK
jgi:peptidoglycan/LPS O-acetylase OafA/YrhL